MTILGTVFVIAGFQRVLFLDIIFRRYLQKKSKWKIYTSNGSSNKWESKTAHIIASNVTILVLK